MSPKKWNRLPSADSFGQKWRAIASLTTATARVSLRSLSLNTRPACTGMRSVSKKVGVTLFVVVKVPR
jgi:hypothetical protein